MRSVFLITIFLYSFNSFTQVRTTGGGTLKTKDKNPITIILESFKTQLLSEEDSSEKKLEILGKYLAHMEHSCGLRKKIPKGYTILDSYYNIAFGMKVPTLKEVGKAELCLHSDKTTLCLKKKSHTLNEIMTIVNKDDKIPLLIQKKLQIDSETTEILLEFFTKQGQMNSK